MYLSLNWLSDHVDLSGLSVEEIGRELTMKTALIEGVLDQRAALAGVVVGSVLECGRHPGADRLSVCRVEFGGAEPAHVVCGAPNVAAGQTILYAPVGTRLPNGVKLKSAKIRGEVSEGMICAEDELGLGPEHDGILVLEQGLEPGRPVGELAGLADVVFDIDNKSVTHRPDLWGHRGFARELATIFGRELLPLSLESGLRAGSEGPDIELAAGPGCPLYAGLCVDDVPSRSPDWLRFRLVACGMRPINLIVDLSNYVMLELGQPTHPFDRDKLAGDRIVVRRGLEGETLTTLDDVVRKLTPEDVVIADGSQGVAIAGIMGCAVAEVGDDTQRMFLESASFDPRDVRRTSSRLGLRSEALARFEKALDPALVGQALQRYAALIKQLRPSARVAATWSAAGEARAPELTIPVRPDMVRARLGLAVPDDEMVAILGSLGFGVGSATAGRLDVSVPSWRATRDVSLPEDIVEEIGRIAGYDRVAQVAPTGPLLLGERDSLLVVEEGLRDALAGAAGFTEVFHYSTIRDRTVELFGLGGDGPRLANALQQDAARLRPSVVPELLMGLEAWLRHEQQARCFEVGRGYGQSAAGEISESREVAVVLATSGQVDARDLLRELRGVAEDALRSVGRFGVTLRRWTPDENAPWLHAHRAAELCVQDVVVARAGALAPALAARLELAASVATLVFDVRALAGLAVEVPRYVRVARQPAARIDLSFVLDYEQSVDDVIAAMRRAGPKTLRQVEAFDVYRDTKTLGDASRSVAFHLVFQSEDRTLTDQEVNKAREKIVKVVCELGARLR